VTTTDQDTKTFEGAPAWTRTAKSDLFQLAVTNFYGEDTFYEAADVRAARFIGLVRVVAKEDPAWFESFVLWLRDKANVRTAAVVGAVEAARALASADQPGHEMGAARRILGQTLLRADEPAEALSYWLANYGRKMPAPVRRAIADAATRLYTQRNLIKYDSDRKGVRMADVIELTHPSPATPVQSTLFKYILDSARRPTEIPDGLTMLRTRAAVLALPDEQKQDALQSASTLREAGLTWEQASSFGKMTAEKWKALIPSMGYMALLRNLRNFQEADLDRETMIAVAARIGDPNEVAKSRQLPYRFLSAYLTATSPQWTLSLESALQASLANIPALSGSTLVLVDTSSSMSSLGLSAKSTIKPVMAGALFGVALAAKGEQVDLYGFANGVFKHPVRKGAGVLRTTEEFCRRIGEVGHGTEIARSLKATWTGHDRVIIVTDMQTFGGNWGWTGNVSDQIPVNVPIYAFNMQGYAPAMMETGAYRHELGGLTDRTFAMIPLVEAGMRGSWPWEE
jgi:hypothetical protein